jgi:hypothetical protein
MASTHPIRSLYQACHQPARPNRFVWSNSSMGIERTMPNSKKILTKALSRGVKSVCRHGRFPARGPSSCLRLTRPERRTGRRRWALPKASVRGRARDCLRSEGRAKPGRFGGRIRPGGTGPAPCKGGFRSPLEFRFFRGTCFQLVQASGAALRRFHAANQSLRLR